MIEILVALVAAVLYSGISLLVGDLFPFSRYSMYARLRDRRKGAVLYVRAAERFVEPDDLDQVFGLDVDALDPKPVPCSQQWIVYEAQRWFSSRSVQQAPAAGVPVEVGWRLPRIGDDGRLEERLRVVTRGIGQLRP